MGLIEDFTTPTVKKSVCTVGKILVKLPSDERKVLEDILQAARQEEDLPWNKRTYTHPWIAAVLTKNGYPVGRTTIGLHIKGTCSCEQSD